MKKCPFCGAELNDESLYCTECGKELPKGIECPHCGASVNEGDVFCTECGKRIDEVPQATSSEPQKPKCPHCGALINKGDVFCMECGKKIDEVQTEKQDKVVATKECPHCGETIREDAHFCPNCDKYVNEDSAQTAIETSQTEEVEYHYEIEEEPKTWRDYKLPIFGGIFIVLFLGVCWWYYDSSNKRVAREKAIADSLEIVRKDSIRLAEQKEKERQDSLEKVRIQMKQKPYLTLLDKYGQGDNWGKCYFLFDITGDGLPEIWMNIKESEDFHFHVYSCLNGEAKLLFNEELGYNCSFYNGDNYVLMEYAHMGFQVIYKFYLSNNVIKKEKIFETEEAESMNDVVYKEIEEPSITTYELTDKSAIYEIK